MKVSITGVEGSRVTFTSRFAGGHIYQDDDAAFKPVVEMYSQFESYALRVEKMFDTLIQLGGEGMISHMLNLGQKCSPDLGIGFLCYRYGLSAAITIHEDMTNMTLAAVHFTDWAFQMAMDTGEYGKLDFEHKEFDEFILSLRECLGEIHKRQ